MSMGTQEVGHVWVKVNINGTPFIFDPAFKFAHVEDRHSSAVSPLSMGYSRSAVCERCSGHRNRNVRAEREPR